MGDTVVRVHRIGPSSLEQAWARYADPRRWPQWSPYLRSVELDGIASAGVDADTAALRPGLSGTVRGPGQVSVRFLVGEVDERAYRWTWAVSPVLPFGATVRIEMVHTLVATADGTRAGLALRGTWPLVQAYRPVAWWALGHLLRTA